MIVCAHAQKKKYGRDRKGNQRYKCLTCGKMFADQQPRLLGDMRVPLDTAQLALRMLTEGMSIRATERTTGLHRDTICKLLVLFGEACKAFLDRRMRNLTLTHLQFDEQWSWVSRKQARLTADEKAQRHDIGDVFIWTCIDQQTKLMPSFMLGKRSADNARRFLSDVAGRLIFPGAHEADDRDFRQHTYRPIVQISFDGFPGYPEATDLAFDPYAKYGVIIKEYRNANMIYSPSEMVGTRRNGIRGIEGRDERTICTSHVERLNGTQRLFLKRLNRLTYCFSKKLRNLEAAFAMFAAYYNYCWRTRRPGKSGKKRPTAATMAGLTNHAWSFGELFRAVLKPATQS